MCVRGLTRLINSCTVKNPSQSAFVNIVKKAQNIHKPVVVAGCVPQGDRNLNGLEDVSVVGVQQIDRVVEVVEETLKGHKVRLLAKKELPLLDLPKIRKNPLVEIIPLSTGCLGACTYCKTRHARGKLGSYALDAIVRRAKTVIDEGVSEIWLSSEDTGAYGLDIGTDVTVLLKSIVNVLPEVRPTVLVPAAVPAFPAHAWLVALTECCASPGHDEPTVHPGPPGGRGRGAQPPQRVRLPARARASRQQQGAARHEPGVHAGGVRAGGGLHDRARAGDHHHDRA